MNFNCDCIVYDSVSKVKKIDNSEYNICTNCHIVEEYKQLIKEGKINFIDDVMRFNKFNNKKHQNKKRRVNNASSNKRNKKGTLSESRKKSKDK